MKKTSFLPIRERRFFLRTAFPFMKDVVHPNVKGYEVLEKELAVLLKKLDAKYRGGKPAGQRS